MKRDNTTTNYDKGSAVKKSKPTSTVSKKNSYKKQFKIAMAKKLGVPYKTIKKLFPECLNSTLIANHLQPTVTHFTRQEIRNISQDLKLRFEEFH